MDLGTHALAGLAVGAAGARKEPLVAALATGVIASVLPDLDSALYLIDIGLYFKYHRLFTHTIFALPVIAVLAAAAGLAIDRTRLARMLKAGITTPARFSTLLAIAAASVVVHIGLDFLCDYPLRLLYPFSDRDFALYLINYSHFAFTLGFAALTVALLCPLARKAPIPRP